MSTLVPVAHLQARGRRHLRIRAAVHRLRRRWAVRKPVDRAGLLALRFRELSEELAQARVQYRLALDASLLGGFELNLGTGEAQWAPEVALVLGLEPGSLTTDLADWLHLVHPADLPRMVRSLAHDLSDGHRVVECRIVRDDGSLVWVEVRGTVHSQPDGSRMVGVIADITARKSAEMALDHASKHDALTGVCNRAELLRIADERHDAGRPMAVLLLDLDGFKDVNDALGHHVGDLVLVETARRICASVRSTDVVGRLGGDEFVILTDGVDPKGVEVMAGNLLRALRAPVEVGDMPVQVGASIGIAASTLRDVAPALLLQHADVAMYRAKRAGNAWVVYDAAVDVERTQRLALVTDLRAAIDNGDIGVAYQPQTDLRTGRIVAVEALARWHHAVRGPISPIDFISLAEHTGLIAPLTMLMLGKAMTQARIWHVEGWPVRVAVNISPVLLTRSGFAGEVAAACLSASVDPALMTLEITESGVADAGPQALVCLQTLHDLGFTVSIDDFGTGYSSLGYLTQLPATELKLDRAFVARLPDAREIVVVRGVIAMAKELGMTVVAEGIESAKVMSLLAELGCEIGQGFAICRPQGAADVTALLAGEPPAREISGHACLTTPWPHPPGGVVTIAHSARQEPSSRRMSQGEELAPYRSR